MLASGSDDPPSARRPTDPCALGTAGGRAGRRRAPRAFERTRRRAEAFPDTQATASFATTPIDGNSSSSLLCNNGACVDHVNGYECRCSVGFLQPDFSVQVDECESVAVVLTSSNGFACLPRDGYRGDLCEVNVDDCVSSPCFGASTALTAWRLFVVCVRPTTRAIGARFFD